MGGSTSQFGRRGEVRPQARSASLVAQRAPLLSFKIPWLPVVVVLAFIAGFVINSQHVLPSWSMGWLSSITDLGL